MAVLITVAGAMPPAPGKKQGKVHDTNGATWYFQGDPTRSFVLGATYSITFETNSFRGMNLNVIKTYDLVGGAATQPAPTQQQFAPTPLTARPGATMPVSIVGSAKDEMIFVCGALNNALGNQNINPMMLAGPDVIGLVEKFRMAWRNTLGKTQSNDTDIRDEVPFS